MGIREAVLLTGVSLCGRKGSSEKGANLQSAADHEAGAAL